MTVEGKNCSVARSRSNAGLEVSFKKRPHRRDLLKVITKLQTLIGKAQALHGNDRNPNGFEQGQDTLNEAFNLCLDARSFDPPE